MRPPPPPLPLTKWSFFVRNGFRRSRGFKRLRKHIYFGYEGFFPPPAKKLGEFLIKDQRYFLSDVRHILYYLCLGYCITVCNLFLWCSVPVSAENIARRQCEGTPSFCCARDEHRNFAKLTKLIPQKVARCFESGWNSKYYQHLRDIWRPSASFTSQ